MPNTLQLNNCLLPVGNDHTTRTITKNLLVLRDHTSLVLGPDVLSAGSQIVRYCQVKAAHVVTTIKLCLVAGAPYTRHGMRRLEFSERKILYPVVKAEK
jgi:hypothetical protein